MVKEFELTVEIRHEYYDLRIKKIKQQKKMTVINKSKKKPLHYFMVVSSPMK